MQTRLFIVSLALLSAGAPLAAAERGSTPAIFQKLLDCRSISGSEARLACFDAQVVTIGSAVDKQELVIADQAQLRRTRRSLFGLALPRLALFGGGGDKQQEEAEFAELLSTITSARQRGDGRWLLVLEDGARWTQSDTRELNFDAKPGQPIRIRRAAMGSYLANINKQTAIRVRREN